MKIEFEWRDFEILLADQAALEEARIKYSSMFRVKSIIG